MYRFRLSDMDENHFPNFSYRMNNLYRKSLSEIEKKEEIVKLDELFDYIGNYLTGLLDLGFINAKNGYNILTQLKSIEMVKLLDSKYRGKINGLSYDSVIEINPDPGEYSGLDKSATYELAMYHELGHIITASNNSDLFVLQKMLKKNYSNVIGKDFDYLKSGFELLDEVVVENIGENILFNRRRLNRPKEVLLRSKSLFPSGSFSSNFVEYREFQEVAYKFIRSLNMTSDGDMNKILDEYSIDMFTPGFYRRLYSEFENDRHKGEDLVRMLICMGKIKEAKYSLFGLGSMFNKDVSLSYLEMSDLSEIYSLHRHFKIQS